MTCPGCLITKDDDGFCKKCLKELFNGKRVDPVLSIDSPLKEESGLYTEFTKRMSISGVQVKYLLKLEDGKLNLTQQGGQYILKPVPSGPFKNLDQAPANEHLTMQIARQVFKISAPPNAVLHFKDGTPAYLVKRFDLKLDGNKHQQEDFAQIAQLSEETHGKDYKYDMSYEEIGNLIKQHLATHQVEMEKFYRLVLFNYTFSNGDAHVKNFSAIRTDSGDYVLTPAYDLLCTKLHSPGESDMALTLFKEGFSEAYQEIGFYTHFDFLLLGNKLGIREARAARIIDEFRNDRGEILDLIGKSFLRDDIKDLYKEYYKDRVKRLKMEWKK
jgi:serine/threonine-protein kinase HipA